MKKFYFMSLFSTLLISSQIEYPFSFSNEKEIPYPEGYRQWTHVKTMLTGVNNHPQRIFDGFHYIYANKKAIKGYKNGTFPDGAVIVFAKHEADSIKGNYISGKRKYVDVMYKNSKVFKDTGGWGFEEFSADSTTDGRLSSERQLGCFNSCHQSKKENDFVFSKYEN